MPIHLNLTAVSGLSAAQAATRLREEGPNELPSSKPRSVFGIAISVATEPMFLLLVACGVLYLLLGDVEEALMLLGFVFVIIGMTFYQERKTERALEALRDLSSPRAAVIRDSQLLRIPGREVVRGDVIMLAEGDRVPADAVILDSLNLATDESLLTGESVPVRKVARSPHQATDMGRPGGDDLPFVFSGSLVVQGQGVAETLATGSRTELGKIGKALQSIEDQHSPLQREIGRLVRNLALVGAGLCAAVILVYGATRGNWTEGFLAGITLAMAILPEEFPVILTVFMALGAWRIARRRVLTRRVPAIETLGSATVLCSDKTGTLTHNRMTVACLSVGDQMLEIQPNDDDALPEPSHQLVEYAVLASQRDPFDPMDRALRSLGTERLGGTEHLHETWSLEAEYPLSPKLPALSHVWKSPDGGALIIAGKGAPEAIADLCHMSGGERARLAQQVGAMADKGLRVLGVAGARYTSAALPAAQHDFEFEFLGLVGFSDPIRASVPGAVAECYTAGIRVIMITGDYPGTAANIARQIGLRSPDDVVTGPELEAMGDDELRQRLRTVNVFARVVPEQKLRLVQALKANGEVVAMTGDGVNDAPALKAAHIGIAMGARGTDVAREAAALVLLDDDFTAIVAAVRLGRRIFDNLQKAIAYTFAIHVPIAGLSLIPVVCKWPLVLLPVHIVCLELLIDPACAVVFESEREESDVMSRPPRPSGQPLFGSHNILLSVLQGASVLAVALGVFMTSSFLMQLPMNESRALTFTTLIVANLCLIITNRSWKQSAIASLRTPNAAQWWVIAGGLGLLAMIFCTPLLQRLFRFDPLSLTDIAVCVAGGAVSIVCFELFKVLHVRRAASQAAVAGEQRARKDGGVKRSLGSKRGGRYELE